MQSSSRGHRRGNASSSSNKSHRGTAKLNSWLRPAENWTWQELDAEIDRFVKHITLSLNERAMREAAIVLLSDVCLSVLPECKVSVVGSFAFDLALPSSDVDLCLQQVEGDPTIALERLEHALKTEPDVADVELILARIPILKVVFHSGVQVDLNTSFNQSPVDAISRLQRFLTRHPQARGVILLVKSLLRQWGLGNVFTAGLSSTSVYLLVERFFALRESASSATDLPRLVSQNIEASPTHTPRSESSWGPTASEESVSSVDRSTLTASLLVEFLEHCCSDWYMYGFKLFDPSDPNNEVSRGTKRVLEIQALMTHARSSLLAVTTGARPMGAPLSQLSAIVADPRGAPPRAEALSIRVGNKIVRN